MISAAPIPDSSDSGTLEIAPRLGSWLEEYGEISAILPVLVGLFVTSRFQLRGAQALLVNLAIAALTRQAVVQLKKQAHTPSTTTISQNGAVAASGSAVNHPAEDYTIVHSTPGRLRLRISRLLSDIPYTKRLEKLLVAEERVIKVRFNRAAASLVIQYDPIGVTELELGMRLLQILEQAEQDFAPQES